MTTKDARHQRIVEILRENGSASVAELGVLLSVTEMTIRRDLEVLETEGALKRFHGGAKLLVGSSYEPPIAIREKTNNEHKQAIARVVAEHIDEGSTILLDGGSTGIAIAEALVERSITVCPLSLRVAWVLSRSTSVRMLLPPGFVRPGELSLSGAETVSYLSDHRFDHYVMTASGFTIANGFTEWNVEDAAVKRAALAAAGQTTAAADASKFGTVGFVSICPIREATTIVTTELDDAPLNQLRAAAQTVVVAAL